MRVCKETALEGYDSPRVTFMFHILQQLNTVEVSKEGRRSREEIKALWKIYYLFGPFLVSL